MRIFQFFIAFSCALSPWLGFPMESESSSQDSSSSHHAFSGICKICNNSWRNDTSKDKQNIQAKLIRHNIVSATRVIRDFNFENSLGDRSLDHLFSQIITIMKQEVISPLLGQGIFRTKQIKNLVAGWQARGYRQETCYFFGIIIEADPNLRKKFGQAIVTLEDNFHTLFHLSEKPDDSLMNSLNNLILDTNNLTLKTIRSKFKKQVHFS